ncbi:MAG: DNA/RNA non-specific endonuclease [Bacteroidales bacterium]|nr:DNA/RNA non-specific endonuclease [Bacteroidales bacterium]
MEFKASRDIALDLTLDRRDDATRVSLGPDGSIIWLQTDHISVFSESSSAAFGCKSLGSGGSTAVFSGEISESPHYYALYPAQEAASCDYSKGEITAVLPHQQTAVAGGFDPAAALAVACSDGENLPFRNAVAILSFVVRNEGIVSITLKATGAQDASIPLAGSARIGWNGGNPSFTILEGKHEVALYGAFEKGQRYYMAVFPGSYNALNLEFRDASGRTAKYYNTTPLELLRNDNVNLFDLEIPDGKWSYPSIDAPEEVTVPASGVVNEVTEVMLSDADGWDVDVSYAGCVSTAFWDDEEGGVCYTVAANTTTAQRTGGITVTLTREGCTPVSETIQVVQEASPAPPVEEGWIRVTRAADLVVDDEYVIAYPQGGKVAGDISSSVMSSESAAFSSDYSKITDLPASAVVLTLGGNSSGWTFANASGKLLGTTSVKNMSWGSGTTTWTITAGSASTPIASTNSDRGKLQYNESAPRFTTYTSSQKDVTLYHRVGGKVTSVSTSSQATGITTSSATISASYNCIDAAPSAAGFKYGTNAASLVAEVTVSAPTAKMGTFSATLSSLLASTTYYYAAFIVENGVTYLGSVQSVTTNAEGGTPSTGGADYGWPELPAQTDRNRDGIDDNNSDLYYSHTFRADAASIRNFSSCYSKSKIHPVWVAAPMHNCYKGNVKRTNAYQPDPNIKCTQNGAFDGYTRGHMVGSSDRNITAPTNRQAFYYSNIGAQLNSGFNTGGGAWNKLEDKVDGFLCQDTLYQVIGCVFDTFTDRYGVTVTPRTASGSQIPTAWYKVLLRTKNGNTGKDVRNCSRDELKCIAFVLGHYGNQSHVPSINDAYTVEQVEAMTGLTFFVNVPNAPKDTYNRTDWGL